MNDNEFNEKMQFYRQRRARNVSLSVMGYFIGVICIIGCTVLFARPISGVIVFLLISALSTGLIIYTKMSTPLEFSGRYGDGYEYDYRYGNDEYSTREVSTDTNGTDGGNAENGEGNSNAKNSFRSDERYYMKRRDVPGLRMFRQVMEIYWLVVTIIYFVISFSTMKWYITWVVWLIGAALDRAIRILWEAHRFDDKGGKR